MSCVPQPFDHQGTNERLVALPYCCRIVAFEVQLESNELKHIHVHKKIIFLNRLQGLQQKDFSRTWKRNVNLKKNNFKINVEQTLLPRQVQHNVFEHTHNNNVPEFFFPIYRLAFLLAIKFSFNQSNPSHKPSPVVPVQLWTCQSRLRRFLMPIFSQVSEVSIELGKSCLFA